MNIPPSGKLFAIYKPKGPSSHDVLYPLKRKYKGEKVGHAGTLDPLASGVLVVAVGRQATKKLHLAEFSEKEYVTTIKLGAYSTTDDDEGGKEDIAVSEAPSLDTVKRAVRSFVGQISQVPPQFSAVKKAGQPAYKGARRGERVELAPRPVEVKGIDIIEYNWPLLKLRVVTGRGVYIRSLARDIGKALKTGGFVLELERTRVGNFRREDAIESL
ncbi:MAG: tRNA pseudouridine(55) synthase TruB [Candidatus Berkelbacteria bacterium]|nr:MAG: tRNA pseudouridine(55) synthase TruB [Candidatus Berkelbacteria bacterium]QQG51854.1 MAG: tRNA pseudouridine(55) synthase TruB [Candidatus Berkelbacteria bacterium]